MEFPHENHRPEPAELLRNLIRFDTTNPPGNEAACIGYIQGLLADNGVESTLLERVPGRPNLIARLQGAGSAPPLLLQGHVDVVTTAGQEWTHPPFQGHEEDGLIWGRGALDMKGGVAMMLSAFLRAKRERAVLPGDVILCILVDEEAGGEYGAGFLVEEHPDLFQDVRYALGEFGGFSMQVGNQRYYPIQVAEKQICWLRLTVRGPGGHGSMPLPNGAMAKAGAFLHHLHPQYLPIHITPPYRMMMEALAAPQSPVKRLVLRQLLNPALADRIMGVFGSLGAAFRPLIRNSASPTIIQGGEKENVHPSSIAITLDCRLLPGFGPNDIIAELQPLLPPDSKLETIRYEPSPAEPDMGLFPVLAETLREADPLGEPIPLLLPGATDGRMFARLGIQPYGFTPMHLPPELKFHGLIHAADERIPKEAISFGAEAIFGVLKRFGQA